jgi:acyl dehydratase
VTPTTRARAVAVGDEAPVFTHELKRSDLIRYAGASGDFYPLHTDDAFARNVGLDGVFAHGMYCAGLLATALTNWLGAGALCRLKVRFVAKAWPGDLLRSRVRATGLRSEAEVILVEFECSLVDAAGEIKISGSGTAALTHETSDRTDGRTARP